MRRKFSILAVILALMLTASAVSAHMNESSNKTFSNFSATEEKNLCPDMTPYNSCSNKKPYLCLNGELIENCSVCGCEEGEDCLSDGTCYFNHRPKIYRIGDVVAKEGEDISFQINEGEKLEFNITAEDEDGDSITYFAVNLPNGSVFEPNGHFLWIPGYGLEKRQYYVTFMVVDNPVTGSPKSSEQNVWIYVGKVNRPPVVKFANHSLKTDENVLLEFKLNAEDPDGDKLIYYVDALPKGANFNNETGEFSWIPDFEQKGNYELTFIVSDGASNVTKKILITVGDVNRPPFAKISYPLQGQEFSLNSDVYFSSSESYDPDNDDLTFVWDFGDGSTITTKETNVKHRYVSPGTYNVTLLVADKKLHSKDTIPIVIQERKIRDTDNDGVRDEIDKCPDTPSYMKVNMYGCPLPKYSKFMNNITTDFSMVDVTNATNVVIGIPGKAKIEFRRNRINLVGKDIDRAIEIKNDTITVKTDLIPELNKSAIITFYHVNFTDPVIVKDGVYCRECKIIDYVNGTLTFFVPHFTSYTLMEWSSYTGYCGDGLCSLYETCYDCEVDCGKCKESMESPGECKELWVCSPWSDCNELDLMTRECEDINQCGTERNKPVEIAECKKGMNLFSLTLFGTVIFLLTVMYLVAEHAKKRLEKRKMNMLELKKFVKGHMYRGYTKDEIKRILKEKGYKDKEIKDIINEVEKEIF